MADVCCVALNSRGYGVKEFQHQDSVVKEWMESHLSLSNFVMYAQTGISATFEFQRTGYLQGPHTDGFPESGFAEVFTDCSNQGRKVAVTVCGSGVE